MLGDWNEVLKALNLWIKRNKRDKIGPKVLTNLPQIKREFTIPYVGKNIRAFYKGKCLKEPSMLKLT